MVLAAWERRASAVGYAAQVITSIRTSILAGFARGHGLKGQRVAQGAFLQLIRPTGTRREFQSTLSRKNISVFQKCESVVSFAHPASVAEGRIAIVTKREAGCGGREGAD